MDSSDDEADDVPFAARRACLARVSDELVRSEPGARRKPAQRADGWTPERIRTFLRTLAACGVVSDAARAAGMSIRSAYNLRNRADGGPLAVAWDAAQQLARRRLADELTSRALHGCVELIIKDGEIIGERHRFDNRLTMAMLTRLDQMRHDSDEDNRAARVVAREFDRFLDIVCAGGDDAAQFIASRVDDELSAAITRNARMLDRLEQHRRATPGLVPPSQPTPVPGKDERKPD